MAFELCCNLTKAELQEGLLSIGAFAFFECTGLTRINIPSTVNSIGEGAFSKCCNLTDFSVSEGNIRYAFREGALIDTKTKELMLFLDDSTRDYHVPDNIVRIGASAFAQREKMIAVTLPERTTSIGNYAFSSCRKLESIAIPDSVNCIGANAFEFCHCLKHVILHEGLIEIGRSAFWASGLTELSIPDSVSRIGEGAFENCEYLTRVNLPTSITEIGKEAFRECKRLRAITIPASVRGFGEYAFFHCNKIRHINYGSMKDDATKIVMAAIESGIPETTVWHCSDGQATIRDMLFSGKLNQTVSWELQKGTLTFSGTGCITKCHDVHFPYKPDKLAIKEGITEISDHAFEINYQLLSCDTIELPASIVHIGENVLKKVTRVVFCGIVSDITNKVNIGANNNSLMCVCWHCIDGNHIPRTFEGTLSTGVHWTIGDGTLTISGIGEITWSETKLFPP